jgi:hypothetical protein
VFFYALPIALIGYTTWRYRRDRMARPVLPPSTPLTVIGAAYLFPFVVWTLPFSNLMSTRFVVVLLCLVQTWFLALVSKTPPRFCRAVCSGYLALNVALFLLAYPVAKTQPPDHVLTSKPPRMRDLANYHADLVEFLERTRPEVILTTRQAGWMFYTVELGVPGSLEEWLSEGKCESIHDRVVVLLSDDLSSEPSRFDDRVRQKCALGPPMGFRGSRVFLMPATGPADSAGTHHKRAAARGNDRRGTAAAD